MAERLQGIDFRVFRSLATEWPYDTVEKIRVELTRGPEATAEEIEESLRCLEGKGWLEEFQPGRWKLTPNGHGSKRSLLGEGLPQSSPTPEG